MQFIEGGWPGANPKDIEFFRIDQNDSVADMPRSWPSVRLEKPAMRYRRTQTFRHCWRPRHAYDHALREKLVIPSHGCARHFPGEESGTHQRFHTPISARKVGGCSTMRNISSTDTRPIRTMRWRPFRQAVEAGAERVILCDTNGGTMPWEIREICQGRTAGVSGAVGDSCP